MKRTFQLSIILLSALSIASHAASPYLSLSGGLGILSDSDISDGGFSGDMSFENGYNIEGAFGYAFDGGRAELALGWLQSDFDEMSAMGMSMPIDGKLSAWTVMLNGYYDINTDSAFTPYLLVGLGVVGAEASTKGEPDQDDTVLGGQLGAGVGYDLTENVILDLKYKYLLTGDLDFDGSDVSLGGHQIQLGARYQF